MSKLLKELDGSEVWVDLDRFGERVCVGIKFPNCCADGKTFKPTRQEIKEIEDAYVRENFSPNWKEELRQEIKEKL